MKEWWINLALREKQTVTLGALIVAVASLYGLIWSPLQSGVASLREQVQKDQQLLVWMQSADQQLQAAAKSPIKPVTTDTAASSLGTVQNALKHSSFAESVTQLVQADNDSVKLTLQQVDFDALITWLTQLWQQHGFVVSQTTIASSNSPGIVTAELTLKSA
jgi:general secretion pathway protein M